MAKSNAGKVFEDNWKNSCDKDGIMCERIKDPAQVFKQSASYSHTNKCDFHVYKYPFFMPLELKSTNKTFITFEDSEESAKKMIHWHQIEGLKSYAEYKGVIAGFILNYRKENEKGNIEADATYFIHINDFCRMIKELNKKSFTIIDLLNYSPIRIKSEKMRVHYRYDISQFMRDVKEKYGSTLA